MGQDVRGGATPIGALVLGAAFLLLASIHFDALALDLEDLLTEEPASTVWVESIGNLMVLAGFIVMLVGAGRHGGSHRGLVVTGLVALVLLRVLSVVLAATAGEETDIELYLVQQLLVESALAVTPLLACVMIAGSGERWLLGMGAAAVLLQGFFFMPPTDLTLWQLAFLSPLLSNLLLAAGSIWVGVRHLKPRAPKAAAAGVAPATAAAPGTVNPAGPWGSPASPAPAAPQAAPSAPPAARNPLDARQARPGAATDARFRPRPAVTVAPRAPPPRKP